MIELVLIGLLVLSALVALGGYVATSYNSRQDMPTLLIAFILAIGFLAMLLKG